jgi:hypothetical protein
MMRARKRYVVTVDGTQFVHDRLQAQWREVDVRDRDWIVDTITAVLVDANPTTRIDIRVE